jgi:hypothetical protein
MECYSEARGLDRSKEIATDLANLASSTGGPTPSVSPAAKSYVARLNHIWECCREDSEAGRLACLKYGPLFLNAHTVFPPTSGEGRSRS